VAGKCNCPVGFNCKHVMALLLTWRAEVFRHSEHDARRLAPEREALTPDAQAWLDSLEPAAEQAEAASGQGILYLLSPADAQLKLFRARLLKGGGYGRPEPIRPDFHRLTWGHVPAYYQPADLPILRLFLALQDSLVFSFGSSLSLRGEEGAQLLRMALRSGRLYLQDGSADPGRHDIQPPPLRAAAMLSCGLAWRRDGQGRQRLGLGGSQDSSASSLTLLPTWPLWYLDAERHEVGEVQLDLPLDIATQLILAPPLDELDALLVSERLRQIGAARRISLPLPEVVTPEEPAGKPLPVLRLQAGRFRHLLATSKADEHAVATLWFEYPGLPRTAGAETPPSLLRSQRAGRSLTLLRDSDSERAAWRLLQAQGLESQRRRLPNLERIDAPVDSLLPAHQDTESWMRFLEVSVPLLEAAGMRVEVADDFPYQLSEAEDWFVEILEDEVGGNGDWFDLDLGVVIDGIRTSLVEPLLRLIASRPRLLEELRLLGDDERVPMPLDERHILPVPALRLRTWLGPLLEFAGNPDRSGHHDHHARPRLSRFNAGALADLDKLPGHWLGGQRLRELGRRLRDFSGISVALPAPGFNATLRPYQQLGLNWLQFLRSYGLAGILADDMGLGKTVQTLAHLHLEKVSGRADRPSLVVLPTSLITNWRNEAQAFAPELKLLTLHGPERSARFAEMAQADV
ncbi:MAG: DEAD/DEAH box helicase, partial [Pseudomonadota bacterium]